ncbi:MAG: HAMP domain-containing sensor histidine kinase [Rhodospirillaceae bacterium]
MIAATQTTGLKAGARPVWQVVGLPAAAMAVVVGFALLIWLGYTGFDAVLTETRRIVGHNLDSSVRIAEVGNRLQKINASLYGLMTVRAAGTEMINVPQELEHLGDQVGKLRAELVDYRERYATPQQVPSLNEALGTLEHYEGAVRWVGSMLEIDFASTVSFLRPFNTMFDGLSQRFDAITAAAVADARARADQAGERANRTVLSLILVTLLAALAIAVVAWLAGRHQQKLRVTAEMLDALVTERTRELAARTADLEVSLTRLREAQATLVMHEKMASLGGLVAGVAHEINTPIGVALTSVTMLTGRVEEIRDVWAAGKLRKSDFDVFLGVMIEGGALLQSNIERAAALVQTFKQVAADRTSETRRSFALRPYLTDVVTSLSPVYRKVGHKVSIDCPDGIEIDGYPGAFAQILSNFIMNSVVHGFHEEQTGQLSISVTERDDASVELIYADDGLGIPADHAARVFDPFFTTRRGNGSTGLGLHIVYNLVTTRFGGSIRMESEAGAGTRFILHFPRIAPE